MDGIVPFINWEGYGVCQKEVFSFSFESGFKIVVQHINQPVFFKAAMNGKQRKRVIVKIGIDLMPGNHGNSEAIKIELITEPA
jgi:hypothetical protein